jgi:hypothetical protein
VILHTYMAGCPCVVPTEWTPAKTCGKPNPKVAEMQSCLNAVSEGKVVKALAHSSDSAL